MQEANLTTTFELYKQNSNLPLVQVQLNVDYHPQENKATPISLFFFCSISKSFIDMTLMMDKPFFKSIIRQTIQSTNWMGLYQSSMIREQSRLDRIKDNLKHNITSGNTKTYLQTSN